MAASPGGPAARPAGLHLVLAACVYDGLLTTAILFAAAAVAVALSGGRSIAPGNPLFQAYLLAVPFAYFGWCWVRGGQTLGMRAWRLRLQCDDASRPGWRRALARYLAAIVSWSALGLGFAWMLVDPRGMSWHDRLSGTRIVRTAPR